MRFYRLVSGDLMDRTALSCHRTFYYDGQNLSSDVPCLRTCSTDPSGLLQACPLSGYGTGDTEYEYDNQFFELPFEQKITVLFLTVSNFCCQIQAFSDWITLSFYDQDGLVWSRNIPYAACSNSKFHQRYNKKVGDSLYRARVYANFSSSEKLQFLSMVSTWLC